MSQRVVHPPTQSGGSIAAVPRRCEGCTASRVLGRYLRSSAADRSIAMLFVLFIVDVGLPFWVAGRGQIGAATKRILATPPRSISICPRCEPAAALSKISKRANHRPRQSEVSGEPDNFWKVSAVTPNWSRSGSTRQEHRKEWTRYRDALEVVMRMLWSSRQSLAQRDTRYPHASSRSGQ